MKAGHVAALIVVFVALAGCRRQNDELTGTWAVDVSPMIAEIKAKKGPDADTSGMEKVYTDFRYRFEDGEMVTFHRLSDGTEKVLSKDPYSVISRENGCVKIKEGPAVDSASYCVQGNTLRITEKGMTETLVAQRVVGD